MKLKLEWALVPVVLAGSAFGADIVFSAPPELRAAIREEIVALHYAAIDASAIDDALFNEKNNVKERASRGDYGFKPAATLPPEVQADLRSGLAGCRARTAREKSEDIKQACGEELAETVWQRYIERVRPERVIEVKKPMKIKDGFGLECATYRPTENTVAVLSPQGPALDPLLRKAVGIMLTKKLEPNGARPTSDILPEEVPPPIAELSQGVAQVLAPLKVPAGCQLPALTIGPDTAPIARTMNALWAATLVGHSSTAEPIACSIGLDAAPRRAAHAAGPVLHVDLHFGRDFRRHPLWRLGLSGGDGARAAAEQDRNGVRAEASLAITAPSRTPASSRLRSGLLNAEVALRADCHFAAACPVLLRAPMKTLGLVLLLCVGAQEARAQGSGFAGYGSGGALLLLGGFAVTGGLMIGGTVTGIGSSISVAERTASKNWFGASYAFGALNTIAGAIWIPVAIGSAGGRGIDPGWAAMATAHLAIGLWNLITPTIGLLRGAEVRTVAPVFISGRAVGGRRWSGLGVQLATF